MIKINKYQGPIFIITNKLNLNHFNNHNAKISYFSTRAVDIMDVCGCGDTFLASLALGYLCTRKIESVIMVANKATSHRNNYASNF